MTHLHGQTEFAAASQASDYVRSGGLTGGLTGELIRAGRALLRMDQAELANLAGLSLETIKRLERFRGPIDATTRTERAMAAAFRSRGVVFELGAGLGLRLVA